MIGGRQYNSPLRQKSKPNELLQLIGSPSESAEKAGEGQVLQGLPQEPPKGQECASHQEMLGHFHAQQAQPAPGQLKQAQHGHGQQAQVSDLQQPWAGTGAQPEGPQHAGNPGSQAASMQAADEQAGTASSNPLSVQQQR